MKNNKRIKKGEAVSAYKAVKADENANDGDEPISVQCCQKIQRSPECFKINFPTRACDIDTLPLNDVLKESGKHFVGNDGQRGELLPK